MFPVSRGFYLTDATGVFYNSLWKFDLLILIFFFFLVTSQLSAVQVENYLISLVARDCSIMLTFQRAKPK